MNISDPTTIITVVAATVVSSFVGFFAWKIYRLTLRYKALLTIQMDYRSPKMGYAVDRLWRFYREECGGVEQALRTKYRGILREERTEVDRTEKAKKIEARETTLDNQRRIVSHFYSHLAALYFNEILPPKYIFENWSKHDLVIIPCILLPMENELVDFINAEFEEHVPHWEEKDLKLEKLDKNSNLYRLYKDSLSYPNMADEKERLIHDLYIGTASGIISGLIIAVAVMAVKERASFWLGVLTVIVVWVIMLSLVKVGVWYKYR